jgi:hypothetical protein
MRRVDASGGFARLVALARSRILDCPRCRFEVKPARGLLLLRYYKADICAALEGHEATPRSLDDLSRRC